MRKIIVFNLTSVDGFIAGEDDNIDWHNVDDEFNAFSIEQTAQFGTIIFGRTTYELFESYWPKALKDPTTSDDDRKVAQIIEDAKKIVFSKTLTNPKWTNTKVFSEIDIERIKEWKSSGGRDAVIFGSGTIVSQFTKLNLIDEYRILINPVVLGRGKSMFLNKVNLKRIDTRAFKNGNVLITYIPNNT